MFFIKKFIGKGKKLVFFKNSDAVSDKNQNDFNELFSCLMQQRFSLKFLSEKDVTSEDVEKLKMDSAVTFVLEEISTNAVIDYKRFHKI